MVQPSKNRRKQLVSNPAFGVAEVCETRTLLCAACGAVPDAMTENVEPGAEVESTFIAEDCPNGEMELTSLECPEVMKELDPEFASLIFASTSSGEVSAEPYVVEEFALLGDDSPEFVEYNEDGLPTGWDPSWGYRFLSVEPAFESDIAIADGGSSNNVELEEFTDFIDVKMLESVDMPTDFEPVPEDETLEGTLNPADLIGFCHFVEMPADEMDVKAETDGLDENTVCTTEFDPAVSDMESPNIMYVMRGNLPVAEGESGELMAEVDVAEVLTEGEELWQTFDADSGEVLPEDEMYMIYSSMPGNVEEQPKADGEVEAEYQENLEDVPMYFERTDFDSMNELPLESPVVLGEEEVVFEELTGEEFLRNLDGIEDPNVIFQSSAGGGGPEIFQSGSPQIAPSEDNVLPVLSSSVIVFGQSSNLAEAAGTLVARVSDETSSNGPSVKRSVSATRPTGRVRPSVVSRSESSNTTDELTPLLGDGEQPKDENTIEEVPESSDVRSDVPAKEGEESTTKSDKAKVHTVAYQPQQNRSIDLFMSQFHSEIYAN